MLLDDVHDAPRHAGDVTDPRPSRPGHRQTYTGGHHEEVRTRGTVPDRVPQRLAEGQATSLGALRRTLLLVGRKGAFLKLLPVVQNFDGNVV